MLELARVRQAQLALVDTLMTYLAQSHNIVGMITTTPRAGCYMMIMLYLMLTTWHSADALLLIMHVFFDACVSLQAPVLVINTTHAAVLELHKSELVELETDIADRHEPSQALDEIMKRSLQLRSCRRQPARFTPAVHEACLLGFNAIHGNGVLPCFPTTINSPAVELELLVGLS